MTTAWREEYDDCRRQISNALMSRCARLMGIPIEGEQIRLLFFNRTYLIAPDRMEDIHGRPPTDAVGLVLCRYMLQYPPLPVQDGGLTTFRELTGAGPLVASFTRNTNKLIASTFASDVKTLATRSLELNGVVQTEEAGYDLSIRFPALPGIPLFLQFNAADDMFPAQCNLLFYQSAERYLDMQSLFVLGTFLAGSLVSGKTDETHKPSEAGAC